MSSPYALPGGAPKQRRTKAWLLFLAAVITAAGVGLLAGRVLGPALKGLFAGGRFAVGELAGDFRATTLDGRELRLFDLRGKVVVLDFWATWCGPCMRELPAVVAAHSRFAGREDLVMLGISLDRSAGDLKRVIAEKGVAWPQVFDQDMAAPVAEVFGVRAIPFALVIGRDGKVFARDVAGEDLAAVIDKALAAAG